MIPRLSLPRLALAAALAFCLPPASAPAAAQDQTNSLDSLFPDPVVARGKGFEIKRSALDDAFYTFKAAMAKQKQVIPEAARPQIESNILQQLIITKIEVLKATDAEKKQVSDQVAKDLEDFRKSAPSDLAFQDKLKSGGATLDQIRARREEEQLGRAVLIRELVPSNALADDAVKKFYDANPDKFVIPEKVRVAQILISAYDPVSGAPLPPDQKKEKEKLARQVQAQATNGADFAKLARQYSDDDSTKDKGGEYPPFARGVLGPDFQPIEIAAFTLKTNQVSDLVETRVGYHIIKLLEKIPPSAADLPAATSWIKDRLIEAEINRQLTNFVTKTEAEYDVKISDLRFPAPLPPP
ncbi:MAG: peptidylprolyl isomerase [Verrucomicrobiota bacterium]|jgi:parvulin-like peptidyl-prolyl isomerase